MKLRFSLVSTMLAGTLIKIQKRYLTAEDNFNIIIKCEFIYPLAPDLMNDKENRKRTRRKIDENIHAKGSRNQ